MTTMSTVSPGRHFCRAETSPSDKEGAGIPAGLSPQREAWASLKMTNGQQGYWGAAFPANHHEPGKLHGQVACPEGTLAPE